MSKSQGLIWSSQTHHYILESRILSLQQGLKGFLLSLCRNQVPPPQHPAKEMETTRRTSCLSPKVVSLKDALNSKLARRGSLNTHSTCSTSAATLSPKSITSASSRNGPHTPRRHSKLQMSATKPQSKSKPHLCPPDLSSHDDNDDDSFEMSADFTDQWWDEGKNGPEEKPSEKTTEKKKKVKKKVVRRVSVSEMSPADRLKMAAATTRIRTKEGGGDDAAIHEALRKLRSAAAPAGATEIGAGERRGRDKGATRRARSRSRIREKAERHRSKSRGAKSDERSKKSEEEEPSAPRASRSKSRAKRDSEKQRSKSKAGSSEQKIESPPGRTKRNLTRARSKSRARKSTEEKEK